MMLTNEQQGLVDENKQLIHYLIAHKLDVEMRDYEDVYQSGMLGLCKAVATYDSAKGSAFSTYASECILNEIGMFYRKENKIRTRTISLDEPYRSNGYEDDTDGENTLGAVLTDSRDNYDEFIEREEMVQRVNIILNCLTENETAIALLRVADFTQCEISEYLKKETKERIRLSQAYVSRVLTNLKIALPKYEENFRGDDTDNYVFSCNENWYGIKICFGKELVSQKLERICGLVKKCYFGKRIIRHTTKSIEIIAIRDSSFFELLAKIRITLRFMEASSSN